MKRIGLMTGLLVAAFAAVPAHADMSVLLWKTSKVCQIWDNVGGNMPTPVDYVVVAKVANWDAAVDKLNAMVAAGRCW